MLHRIERLSRKCHLAVTVEPDYLKHKHKTALDCAENLSSGVMLKIVRSLLEGMSVAWMRGMVLRGSCRAQKFGCRPLAGIWVVISVRYKKGKWGTRKFIETCPDRRTPASTWSELREDGKGQHVNHSLHIQLSAARRSNCCTMNPQLPCRRSQPGNLEICKRAPRASL